MLYEAMKKEHAPDVRRLQNAWYAEHITYGYAAETQDEIVGHITPYCMVAIDAQSVVGFIMADTKTDNEMCVFPAGASYLEINDLYVAKSYRSRGIGGALLERCERRAREEGIDYMLLSSATKDAEAVRRFYTNNKYTIWTTTFFKGPG